MKIGMDGVRGLPVVVHLQCERLTFYAVPNGLAEMLNQVPSSANFSFQDSTSIGHFFSFASPMLLLGGNH